MKPPVGKSGVGFWEIFVAFLENIDFNETYRLFIFRPYFFYHYNQNVCKEILPDSTFQDRSRSQFFGYNNEERCLKINNP